MTLIEQHIVDHCKTADDVIQAALMVQRRRALLINVCVVHEFAG